MRDGRVYRESVPDGQGSKCLYLSEAGLGLKGWGTLAGFAVTALTALADADWLTASRIRRIAVVFAAVAAIFLGADIWLHTRAGVTDAPGCPPVGACRNRGARLLPQLCQIGRRAAR